MPSVYENPDVHALVLLGELNELHVHEGVFCHNWHIAVWRDEGWDDQLFYAVESNSGAQFTQPPFAGLTERRMLTRIVTSTDYDTFKHALNDYWWSKRIPADHLQPDERRLRNLRKRLQRKVGRRLY
jgi:hypothetical protein